MSLSNGVPPHQCYGLVEVVSVRARGRTTDGKHREYGQKLKKIDLKKSVRIAPAEKEEKITQKKFFGVPSVLTENRQPPWAFDRR